jgi:hypothetical protein
VWVAIPRVAYIIKSVLAGLTGIFVANVVSYKGGNIALTVVLSVFGKG